MRLACERRARHSYSEQCPPCIPQSYLNFGWGRRFSLWCNQNDPAPFTDTSASGYRLARVLWIHYVSKAYEFGDTVIMILKKNNRQARPSLLRMTQPAICHTDRTMSLIDYDSLIALATGLTLVG